jgi:tetratricopeptide (TPR) repeat protein
MAFLYAAPYMASATEIIAEGRQARAGGDLAAAGSRYAAAAKIYRDQNDLLAYAHTIRHVADIYQQASNSDEAKPLYEESIELYRSNLNTKILDLANALRPYALLNEVQGNLEVASKLWEEARQLYGSLRVEPGVSECDEHIRKLQQP